MKIAKFIEAFLRVGTKDEAPNSRGNEIYRIEGEVNTGRYLVDFAPDFTSEGWIQFDTAEDAHYFGVWVNPQKLLTLSYAEGDWTLVACPDAARYNAEVESACAFHGQGKVATVIDLDAKTITNVHQDRAECFAR